LDNFWVRHTSKERICRKRWLKSFCVFMPLLLLVFGILVGNGSSLLLTSQAGLSDGVIIQDGALRDSNGPIFQPVQLTNVSVVDLYQAVRDSVVTVTARRVQESIGGAEIDLVQGSGFVYNFNNRMVIITNFHVINQAVEVSVTFADGNGYAANILGFDPYADLAVLSVSAPADQFKPLQVVSSSSLNVGDFVVAVGSPFGLSGSMTTGIVSQLGRTITSPTTSNYPVANVIQTDAPINPGNSGGPLLNSQGQVVGINTATVSESTGIGFAVPSNTLLREINDLVNTGSYNRHPYLGISSVDMNYYIAREMNIDVTYGVLLQQVTRNGPADEAGLRAGNTQRTINGATLTIGGDIITEIDGNRIISTDDLSSFLEENTQPGDQITLTIIRNGQPQNVPVTLGTRPPPNASVNPTPFISQSPEPTATLTSSPNGSPSPTISEVTIVAIIIILVIAVTLAAIIVNIRKKTPAPVEATTYL
jgi:S1-C subfamily serine protease